MNAALFIADVAALASRRQVHRQGKQWLWQRRRRRKSEWERGWWSL